MNAALNGSERISIRNLDFYYGQTKALKNINTARPRPDGYGLYRSLGVWEIDPASRFEPDVRPLPEPARGRRGSVRR